MKRITNLPAYLLRISVLFLILISALSINYISAATTWTGPTALPPNSNAPAPLNVGTTNQVKDANLSVGASANSNTAIGLSTYGANVVKGWQTIGGVTAPTQLLELKGAAGTDGIKFPDGTVQVSAGGSPSGMYAPFKGPTCPTGWFAADGTNGTVDLRGQFVRGWSNGAALDSGRVAGTSQGDAIRNITGAFGAVTGGNSASGAFASNGSPFVHIVAGTGGTDNGWTFDTSRTVPTASENRPTNIALLYCMKS